MDRGDFFAGVPPTVAVNDAGHVLVAFGRRRLGVPTTLYVRIRHRDGWAAPAQPLGPLLAYGELRATITRADRAAVAWWTQEGDTGGAGVGETGPPRYFAAVADTGGRFGQGVQVDTGTAYPEAGFDIAVDAFPRTPRIDVVMSRSGRVRLAWTGAVAQASVLRAATMDGGGLGPFEDLGPGELLDLASDGRDRAVALRSGPGISANLAEPGRPFSAAAETVANDAADDGAVAFDPRSHRIVAAWSATRAAVRQPFR
jgi:hypothetical protein